MLWRGTLDEPGIATFSAPTINGQPARMLAGNVFEAMLDLPVGANNVTIQAQDGSGNVATKNYSVNVTGGGAMYTYDANGNLASKTEGADSWTYSWSALNQMTAVAKNSLTQATYAYDALGRRVQKVAGGVTTKWLYDNDDVVAQTTSGGSVTQLRFIHSRMLDEPIAIEEGAVTTFLHADFLGSIVRHTNSVGVVVNTLSYDSWGRLETGTPTLFGFTGREWDSEARLWYNRLRWYDPVQGRFISTDALGPMVAGNPYAYASGNPARFTDPFGLMSAECDAILKAIEAIMRILWQKRVDRELPLFELNPKELEGHRTNYENHQKALRKLLDSYQKCGDPPSGTEDACKRPYPEPVAEPVNNGPLPGRHAKPDLVPFLGLLLLILLLTPVLA